MDTKTFTIAGLAAAGGVSSRAVRFYVQQGLLPVARGVGPGSHYTQEHLERLKQIGQLQRMGHSLAAIKEIPVGASASVVAEREFFPPAVTDKLAALSGGISSELVTRVGLIPGVTVEFDATKYQPTVEGLLAMRELAWEIFGKKS